MTWRWNWHPWGPLCCGLLAALVAVYLMQLYVEQQLEGKQLLNVDPTQEVQQIHVVVANQALEAGQTLELAMMSARQLPRAGVATDILHPGEAAWLVGQQLVHPVSAGQPIQRLHVIDVSSDSAYFSAILQPGQRAMTLNVGPQQSHSGLIRVGDLVDFFDLSAPQPTLLDTAIEVIATGSEYQYRSVNSLQDENRHFNGEYRTLTFAINAENVPVYERLQRNHQLAFWLRAPDDEGILLSPPQAIEVDWIIGGQGSPESYSRAEYSWL